MGVAPENLGFPETMRFVDIAIPTAAGECRLRARKGSGAHAECTARSLNSTCRNVQNDARKAHETNRNSLHIKHSVNIAPLRRQCNHIVAAVIFASSTYRSCHGYTGAPMQSGYSV
jgi:hypothetical protein